MKQLKPLSVYAFTIFSNAALSFATFALLTHHLTDVDYGIINLYNSFIILLIPFIGAGVPYILAVDYFKMDKEQFRVQFTNAWMIPVMGCLLFSLLSFLLHPYIEKFTKVNHVFAIGASFICLLNVLNEIILNLIRNKERYFLFAGYSLLKNIIEVGSTILLVIVLGYNWVGRLSSNFLALLSSFFIICFIVYKWHLLKAAIDRKIIMAILVAGLPFILERLAVFTMVYSDRFFIDYFGNTAEVGHYSAGAQFAVIVNLSILTLNNTFYPSMFKELSQRVVNYQRVKKIVWLFLGLSATVTFIVVISIPFFFKYFIGQEFQPGRIYAANLAVGFFFWSIYNVLVVFLLNLRKNKQIMLISITGMLLSIAGNFIFVSQLGAIGATYAKNIVYLSMAVITLAFTGKYYDVKKIFI